MKLYYIANMRVPTDRAEGIQIMKTCEALAKKGLDLELVVPRRYSGIRVNPYDYFNIDNNFKIKKIFTLDLVFLGRLGFLLHTFTYAIFVYLYLLFKQNYKVYSRDENILLILSLLKREMYWESHRGNWNKRVKALSKRISALFVISQGLKDMYVNNGITRSKIYVLPDAVDLSKFINTTNKDKARNYLKLPLQINIIGYIGLLDKWKGVDTFLKSSKNFNPKKVIFVVIGGNIDEIRSYKKKYPNVIFLGYIPYKDLPNNQKAFDILVIPNSAKFKISAHYTSPLKLFAHMTSGVPIIASNLPSIREIVDESSALLIEPDSPDALTSGVQTLLADSELSQLLAKNALEKVKKYTWDNRAENMMNILGYDIMVQNND